jgi:hypothetical protein
MGESRTPSPAAGWYRDPPGAYEYGYWDGSGWRPDVTAAISKMLASRSAAAWRSRWSWSRRLHHELAADGIGRGALARIGEFVARDETVERIAETHSVYNSPGDDGYVVLTDRRLLRLTGSRRRAQVRDFALQSISVAESEWAGITVVASGKTWRIGRMNVHDADDMAHAIRGRSSGRRTGPATPLGKIKRWRVTEE